MTSAHPVSTDTRALSRKRRVLLIAGGLSAVGVAGGAVYVATHASQPLTHAAFPDVPGAMLTLERLRTSPMRTRAGWDLPHVLHHVAQSIDCSLDGFPQVKPAWFRGTVGSAAFAVFSARGQMSHGLAEPIPGAPPIMEGQAMGAAVDRALHALVRFDQHAGSLAPHFAYGILSKTEYARAHLMHLANHWDLVDAV